VNPTRIVDLITTVDVGEDSATCAMAPSTLVVSKKSSSVS